VGAVVRSAGRKEGDLFKYEKYTGGFEEKDPKNNV